MSSGVRVEGGVAYVPLAGGLEAAVDVADLPIISGRRWRSQPSGRTYYAVSTERADDGRRTTVRLHRLLLDGVCLIDHIDGDGLNNRRSNLRPASYVGNARNTRLRKDSSSGFRGVSAFRDRFRSTIRVEGKTLHLGVFLTAQEAARAYDAAASLYFGEFARTNVSLGLLNG